MNSRRCLAIVAGAVVPTAVLLAGGPVSAAPADTEPAPAFVIVDNSQGTQFAGGETFYPTGPLDADTLVVIANPDGSLPDGLTETTLEELTAPDGDPASASPADHGMTVANDNLGAPSPPAESEDLLTSYHSYFATSVDWSGSYAGGGVIGYDWAATVRYNFYGGGGTSQRNVGQGLGYYRGYNGGTFGIWSQWYGLGSATSTGGGASVPWGNVAATAKFRAKCATTTICGGSFTP